MIQICNILLQRSIYPLSSIAHCESLLTTSLASLMLVARFSHLYVICTYCVRITKRLRRRSYKERAPDNAFRADQCHAIAIANYIYKIELIID